MFSDEEAWDVLEDIPNDSAAALVLIEHHWAVPLRDAIVRAGGIGLSDGFIQPADLVAIGLMSAAEAEEQQRCIRPRRPRVTAPFKAKGHSTTEVLEMRARRVVRRTARRTARRR